MIRMRKLKENYPSKSEFQNLEREIKDKYGENFIRDIMDRLDVDTYDMELYQDIYNVVEPYIDELPKAIQNPIKFGWKLVLEGKMIIAGKGWRNKYPQIMSKFIYDISGGTYNHEDTYPHYILSYEDIVLKEEPSCLNQKKYRIEAEKALKNRIFDTKRMLGESINLRYLEKLQEMDLEELVRESLMVTKILDSYYE